MEYFEEIDEEIDSEEEFEEEYEQEKQQLYFTKEEANSQMFFFEGLVYLNYCFFIIQTYIKGFIITKQADEIHVYIPNKFLSEILIFFAKSSLLNANYLVDCFGLD